MPPTFDQKDQSILDERITAWNGRTGPRVGDFVIMGECDVRRFTHDWGDDIQVTSGIGGPGSFYFDGNGFMDYSGGLDPAIPKSQLIETGATRDGHAWFFHHDHRRAHNGVNFFVTCRVYRRIDVSGMLNDAMEHGYNISDWPVEDICMDLICFAADCEDASVEQLTPFVKAWKDNHGTNAVPGVADW